MKLDLGGSGLESPVVVSMIGNIITVLQLILWTRIPCFLAAVHIISSSNFLFI